MTQCNSNLAKYSSCLHFWHSALYFKKLLIISLKSYSNVNTRSSLFWDITQCPLVVCYWCFMANYRLHLQASSCPRPLKMRTMSWPGTLVTMPRNIPEEQDPFIRRQKPEITQVKIRRLKYIFKIPMQWMSHWSSSNYIHPRHHSELCSMSRREQILLFIWRKRLHEGKLQYFNSTPSKVHV